MARIKIDPNIILGKGATATIYKAHFEGVICAAKVYNDSKRFNKNKIDAMLANPPTNLFIQFADEVYPQLAWPKQIIRVNNGHGYIMPIIDMNRSFPLDYYYDSILFKKLNAPEESAISYKLEIARNLASIIADLHKHGHYFVDLKPQNVRVFRHTHIVSLLDCDGFSVSAESNRRYPAELISTDYISPEAYKKQLSPQVLGEEQDRYALAVILFQLLNNGNHPFQGIVHDDTIIAPTNDEKAALGLYPYGLTKDPRILPRSQSTHELWPTTTRGLFDRAFIGDHKNRPSALEWAEHFGHILRDKVLVRCDKFPLDISHMRFKHKECSKCYLDNLSKIKSNSNANRSTNNQRNTINIESTDNKIPPNLNKKSELSAISWLMKVVFFMIILMGAIIVYDDTPLYSSTPSINITKPVVDKPSLEAGEKVDQGWSYMNPDQPDHIDYTKAFHLNMEGYDLGNPEGASNIGLLYEKGLGVIQSYDSAIYWYGMAMTRSHHSAQAELGLARIYLLRKPVTLESIEKIKGLLDKASIQINNGHWQSDVARFQKELHDLKSQLDAKINPINLSSQPKKTNVIDEPKSDKKLLAWKKRNPWFGTNKEMSDYALLVHESLAKSQIIVGSDAYYSYIDKSVHDKFPSYYNKKNINSEVDTQAKAGPQSGEIERATQAIIKKVDRTWILPVDATEGLKCNIRVLLMSDGTVISAKVIKSSGDEIFDRSAENAVYKASPLPVPADKELFAREFRSFAYTFKSR